MNFLKSYFWYSKGQRNGILFLLFCMLCLQALIHFGDFTMQEQSGAHQEEYAALQKRIDSLQRASRSDKKHILPFNPNYLTDFKGYRIGMSPEEIDRLLTYRASGLFMNSAVEFQEVTRISDSLLLQISPYLQFPQKKPRTSVAKTSTVQRMTTTASKTNVGDLNAVTAHELLDIPGVNEQLARRIVSYRNLIRGYSLEDQLLEVYHLDEPTAHRILKSFPIRTLPEIKRLDVNEATFRQVLKLPYVDYTMTKRIFAYRDSVQHIHSLEELKKLDSFPLEKFDRITLYLQAD